MRIPLDPASTAFYHQYVLTGDSRNHSIALRCESLLDRNHLAQALQLTMQRHPLLRSRAVADRSTPRYWYYWETLEGEAALPLPLTWVEVECAKNRTRQEIRKIEQEQLNLPICLEQSYPFRVTAFQCQAPTITHLQLVISHAAADGRSLVLWLKDLLGFYQELANSNAPNPDPLGFAGGNWETLFHCPIDQFTRRIIQTPVLRDNQRRRMQNEGLTGERSDWSALALVLERNQAKRNLGPTMASFPGLQTHPEPERHPLQGLHYTLPSKALEKLTTLAQAYQTNGYDLITVAYIRAHLAMTRELGEAPSQIPLSLLSDLRQVSRNAALAPLLGNLVMGIRLPINLATSQADAIPYLLQTITEQKLAGLKDWKLNLKKNLMLAVIQEPVPTEGLKSFMQVVTQERKAIPVSHLGQLDRLFPQAKALKISQIETTPVASPVSLQTLQWNNQISIAYSYLGGVIADDAAKQLWERFIAELEQFVASPVPTVDPGTQEG